MAFVPALHVDPSLAAPWANFTDMTVASQLLVLLIATLLPQPLHAWPRHHLSMGAVMRAVSCYLYQTHWMITTIAGTLDT